MEYDYLKIIIETLQESVTKNGERALTNKWLLNILKMADKKIDREDNEPNGTESDIY